MGFVDAAESPVLHHVMWVKPDLANGILQVEDRLTIPPELRRDGQFTFQLHAQLQLDEVKGIKQLAETTAQLATYSMALPAQQQEMTLRYAGKFSSTRECQWLKQACIRLDEEGLYLDASSHWYVDSANVRHTFELHLDLPQDWVSLSQGKATDQGWQIQQPQRSIYLLAGKFHVYRQAGQHAEALVYLQTADEQLAQRYLQQTQHYLSSYSELLGAYPYSKFVTVESFWETGWGMPSFTLLGSKVMRLPFIPYTSLPHEILHNWWGNGVYVDSREGNWSEGLTAYLADHHLKAAKGEGANYRRSALQKYATFVSQQNDFPLSQFRGRHNEASAAIGYNKGLMLFHMLQQQLGEKAFLQGLRQFYQRYQFQQASFSDLLHSLGVTDKAFAQQWLQRTGAPHLTLQQVQLQPQEQGYQLTVQLQQAAPAFALHVPLRLRFADGQEQWQQLHLQQAQQSFQLALDKQPTELAIDPEFAVFRLPDAAELPASIGALYGQGEKTYVLARQLDKAMLAAWVKWLQGLQHSGQPVSWQYDDAPLPNSGTVVLLGADNTALEGLLTRAKQPFRMTEAAYTLNSVQYTCGVHTLALALRAGQQQIVLLDASTPQGLEHMLRKLRHYSKYSYVLFHSGNGKNVAKGQWEITASPLHHHFINKKD